MKNFRLWITLVSAALWFVCAVLIYYFVLPNDITALASSLRFATVEKQEPILQWLLPIILSAIVSFVGLFIVGYRKQADTGLETATINRILQSDVAEIKRDVQSINETLQKVAAKAELQEYKIQELKEQVKEVDARVDEVHRQRR